MYCINNGLSFTYNYAVADPILNSIFCEEGKNDMFRDPLSVWAISRAASIRRSSRTPVPAVDMASDKSLAA